MSNAPKGIINLGNTCYLNACIQILSVLEPLWVIMQKYNDSRNRTCIESPLWKQWKNIMFIMKSAGNSTESLYPNGFFSTLQQIAKQKKFECFEKNSQEDVSEFIHFFFSSLHSCIKEPYSISIQGQVQNNIDKIALPVCQYLQNIYEKDEYSMITELSSGVMIHCIDSINKTVEDEYLSLKPEVFTVLNLPIPSLSSVNPHIPFSIYDCLDHFSNVEKLENENAWFNEKTNQKENVNKYIRFWNFPKVLWISINRSSYDGKKYMNLITFPLELDLTQYCMGYKRRENVFELVGICNHIGTVDNGHYTSFVQKEEKWYYCDDTTIQSVEDTKHLETRYASCLIYVKKNSIV